MRLFEQRAEQTRLAAEVKTRTAPSKARLPSTTPSEISTRTGGALRDTGDEGVPANNRPRNAQEKMLMQWS
jgi:hypothetical protein